VRYRGREMGDEFLREDIRDTLVETVRRAEIWISEHMRRGSRMIGLERQDWAQFPQGALREALVNAVAHRDYTIRGEGIRIALFGDRMECYSPGRLPGHVTVENIAAERFSRNETLVQVLADYGLIELPQCADRNERAENDKGRREQEDPDQRKLSKSSLVRRKYAKPATKRTNATTAE